MIGLGLRWPKARNNGDSAPEANHADIAMPAGLNGSQQGIDTTRKVVVALQSAPEPAGTEVSQHAAVQRNGEVKEDAVTASSSGPKPEDHASSLMVPSPAAPLNPAAQPSPAQAELQELTARVQFALGNRFLVQRPIAIGGMATIFLLQHRLHGGLFVAKVLHPELVNMPGVVAGFRMEATHAAQLGNHPNAVPVFDFGESGDLFYLLMPYIEGADLDRVLLKAGPLSREETLQMAAQLSSLLCHAESLGIVHGDLSPGNIRLDIYGQYQMLDLGLSQPCGPQDRPYSAGTPLYNSPEQLAGKPLDIRSDLYSLGAVLCECLSNRPAFYADTLEAIHARHRSGDWELPETLNEADPLRRLLQTLLSVDPDNRPQSAYELSGILHALGWARPEFRPAPPGLEPFMKTPEIAPRKRLSQ